MRYGRENEIEEKKRKGEKKKRKGKEKERGKSASFFLISLSFQWSGLIGPRSKVLLRDKGYMWVSKLRSFTKNPIKENCEIPSTALQEAGILPTLVYFPP